MANHRKLRHLFVVSVLLAALIALAAPALASVKAQSSEGLDPDTQFYVPKPNHDAVEQVAELTAQGRKDDAALIRAIINTPTAVWVTGGSPKDTEKQVRQISH